MATVSRPTTVEMTLAAELVESSSVEPGGITVTCGYTTASPYSVFLLFAGGTRWEFDRDLLREALGRTMAGYGDVRTVNHGPNVLINFNVPAGYAAILLDRGDLRAFLRATERACEFGAEVLDFNAELDQLLKDGAR